MRKQLAFAAVIAALMLMFVMNFTGAILDFIFQTMAIVLLALALLLVFWRRIFPKK